MESSVEVHVLGPLELFIEGRLVEVRGRRERAVLALLAVEVGRPVPVHRLGELLWGDEPPRSADKTLQTFVSRLRNVLGHVPDRLVRRERSYLLDLPPEATDLGRFRLLIRRAAKASTAGDAEAAVESLLPALALWRGGHPADLGTTPAARAVEQLIQREHGAAVEALVTARLATGDLDAAVADTEAELVRHPDHEPLWALLMRAHAAAGRPTASLEAYERCRRWLADELGLDPSPSLTDLHARVLRGDPALLPAIAGSTGPVVPDTGGPAPEATRPSSFRQGGPPPTLAPLIGRESELDRLRSMLTTFRLVTVTGTGGVGKTRLAVEGIATGHDAVWCDLARIGADSDVEHAIAAAVGLIVPPRTPILMATSSALSGSSVTLVLDNCEHVLDGVRVAVVNLLRSCPELTVLGTSRQPLAIAGEHVLPLSPLATEAGGPAQVLFRAAVERAGGDLGTDVDGDLLERLCERLDGLPLALELAAPAVRTLGLQGVLEGLSRRFQLLDVAWDATGRERDLRGTVAWSETLLPPASRELFRALSTFAGPFTPSMVSEVCAPGVPDVANALAGLVDRSLLEPVPGAPPRYRLLENVRDYGRDALGGSARDVLSRRHADWIATRCDHVAERLWEDDEIGLVRSLTDVIDEVRAAVDWVLTAGDADTGLRIVAGLHGPMILSVRTDMAAWVRDLLERFGDTPHPQLAASWGARAHWLLVCEEDADAAAAAAARADAAVGDDPAPPDVWHYRTQVALRAYDVDQAQRLLDDARATGLPSGWDHFIESSIAPMELALGRHESVTERIGRLAGAAETTGSLVLRQMYWMAVASLEHGHDPPRLLAAMREVQKAVMKDETRFVAQIVTMVTATCASRSGDRELAAATFDEVLGRWGAVGAWRYEWNTIREFTALLASERLDEDVVVLAAAARSSTTAPRLIGEQLETIRAAVGMARDRLPNDVFAAAETRGAAMTDRAALAHARGALDRMTF